ncbi:hypothetical protein Golomagni_01648 [Golovinomyces magnicellulatus]|nr:hypothetical protein Golomagni_01648 [Golovinomyces magnicellulatus]
MSSKLGIKCRGNYLLFFRRNIDCKGVLSYVLDLPNRHPVKRSYHIKIHGEFHHLTNHMLGNATQFTYQVPYLSPPLYTHTVHKNLFLTGKLPMH